MHVLSSLMSAIGFKTQLEREIQYMLKQLVKSKRKKNSNKNALNMTLIALCYGKMAESITTALMGANSVCWTPKKMAVDALHLCMKGCITFAGLFLQKLEELIISLLQLICLQNTIYSKNNIRIIVVPVIKLRGLCLVSQTSEDNFCPNETENKHA